MLGRRGPKDNVVGDAGPEKVNERRCEAGDALWMLALHNGHVQRWASVGVGVDRGGCLFSFSKQTSAGQSDPSFLPGCPSVGYGNAHRPSCL